MKTVRVRRRSGPRVDRRSRDPDPRGTRLVLDRQAQRERIAGARKQVECEARARRLVALDAPREPACEAVDGVVLLRLGDRRLVAASRELVAPAREPVRPRDQRLPGATRRNVAGGVTVEDVPVAQRELAHPAADGDRGQPEVACTDRDLLSGCDQRLVHWRQYRAGSLRR